MPSPKIEFTNPNSSNFTRNIMYSSALHLPEIKKDSHKDSTFIIAGSGPSLGDQKVLDTIAQEVEAGAYLLACKAAIFALHSAGFNIDFGVSMDPGQHIASPEKIFKAPGMTHIIASSSDPVLFKYLLEDPKAHVEIFHSATGLDIELYLYATLFENEDCMGGGFNVVNRAITVARYMGASRLILAGTDCGHRAGDDLYVDGSKPFNQKIQMNDNGLIDGTPWLSAPDMVASAVAIAKLAKECDDKGESDKFVILGDVIPASMRKRSIEFLDATARWTN